MRTTIHHVCMLLKSISVPLRVHGWNIKYGSFTVNLCSLRLEWAVAYLVACLLQRSVNILNPSIYRLIFMTPLCSWFSWHHCAAESRKSTVSQYQYNLVWPVVNGGLKRWIINCTSSCSKLMRCTNKKDEVIKSPRTNFQFSWKNPAANYFRPQMVNLWVWENWHLFRWSWVKVIKLPKRDSI